MGGPPSPTTGMNGAGPRAGIAPWTGAANGANGWMTGPRREFDAAKQLAAVELLRQGFRRSQVAARVGITASQLKNLIRAGLDADGTPMPDTFAACVADAEDEVVGSVENQLVEAAVRGEAWAITLFLKGKDRDTYGERAAQTTVNVQNNTLQVDGTAEQRRQTIAALASELDARRALTSAPTTPDDTDIVDAEIVED